MKRLRALVAAALLAAVAAPASAQPVLIRMATIVPDGSAWHLILKEMGEKWKTASGGRVTLRLFPGGIQGDDPIVVSKMRLGTLDAGLLTSVGIGQIDRGVLSLQIPMMYSSYEELDYVLDHMTARLEQRLGDKGFVLLNWADGGRVYFFTKQPVARPDDLKALKLFTWQGDADDTEVWKAAGFNPVPLPSTEVTTALQTGLVTAMPAPPQAAVVLQWYQHARNMTDLKWLFLLGGTVIKKSTWDRIPADAQPAIREAAREAGRRLRDEIRGAEGRDIEAMRKRGLNVVHVDEKTEALWRSAAESAYGHVRGSIVPAESFDEAKRLRDEFRQRASRSSS